MRTPTPRLNPTIYFVNAVDSPEFANLTRALTSSSVIGLDAEWKPQHTHQSTFPTVSLFQIACQFGVGDGSTQPQNDESLVFLLDLSAIPLTCVYNLLKDIFVSPDVLKLGFRFKQDLVYLSSTFCSQGCAPGFDRVEPYLEIMTIYNCLRHKQLGKKLPKESKSLAAICKELLGISISKELQCSDWSGRPLTDEQKIYAAIDAQCLVEIFNAFQTKIVGEGTSFYDATDHQSSKMDLGLKHILVNHISSNMVSRTQYVEALAILRAITSVFPQRVEAGGQVNSRMCNRNTIPIDAKLLQIVRKYADKILLKESDRKPKTSRKKGEKAVSKRSICKENQLVNADVYEGPPPWDLSLGGDGSPKFLCDVMVEGLAKHLRCVGIDAAIPDSKRPETRELIDQAYREKRVLLTRDAKLLRHEYLIKNQIYRVKSLLKNEQLLEVIETFQLTINEDQLMTRCTKCNGRFIQKPLTTEEAVEAAKGFQVIPNCLFNQNIEFWQCMDCKQLYWEGTQYHNAVQKFIDVCRLKE